MLKGAAGRHRSLPWSPLTGGNRLRLLIHFGRFSTAVRQCFCIACSRRNPYYSLVIGFESHVEETIRRHGLLPADEAIVVGVSGGVDSTVLLHLLAELSGRFHWRLTVAHLDHQLRGASSRADARLAERLAGDFGLPFVLERAEVRAFAAAHGLSLEMAARDLRHDFLARTAQSCGAGRICLAHHADDQLELFFLRLLRGTGGEGLGGMKWENPSPADGQLTLVRPLLDLSKAEIYRYARLKRIAFREDLTNSSKDILRNRIRHELLPLLRRSYQVGIDQTILRTMDITGAEADFVTASARDWLRGKLGWRPSGAGKDTNISGAESPWKARGGSLQKLDFELLPPSLQRRVLHLQILELGLAPDFDLVEKLRSKPNKVVSRAARILYGTSTGDAESPPVRTALVRDESGAVKLRGERPPPFCQDSRPWHLNGGVGEIEFQGVKFGWRVTSRKPTSRLRTGSKCEWFDADLVGSPILLRHWQPGDRFEPIGLRRKVKLQDIFTNQKVPRDRRRELILATSHLGEIFWIEDLRISERFKLTRRTKRYLQWTWERL
jgi:tRNA(Ile)-lysidine synthase